MIDARKDRPNTASRAEEISAEQLAHLGDGTIGYIKQMASEELQEAFPQIEGIEPGIRFYGLFAADGSPILLADSRETAMTGAMEQELETVSLH